MFSKIRRYFFPTFAECDDNVQNLKAWLLGYKACSQFYAKEKTNGV